ncbi:MAG: 1-acyl-sn-glycerol-3-phosphate acyltransferase [Actinobacteria bacterium]|nr:1-acyl-sn-glycerol-3-phosphate acyltransferase [Actinomycetota bacterium]
MNAYAFLHRSGFRELLRRLYKIEVDGAERIRATGPAILVANHESIWDPFILGVATPREIHYMAKSELFRSRPLAAVLRSLNAFPVERGGGDRTAMSEAAALLERGELVGSFPQGTSKPERQVGWHRGAARLALVTGAPLVPVRLSGTRPLPWRTRIRIVVGEPLTVAPARPTVAAARDLTERVEQAVRAA